MIFAAKLQRGKSAARHARHQTLVSAAAFILVGVLPAMADPAPKHPDSVVQTAAEGTPAVVLDDNRVESLLGKEISGASGETLGRVIDVLVSKDGELRAVVVDFGGFLGVGTRKVAVAWSTLTFSGTGPVLAMTADELRVTPEYRAGEPVVVVGGAKAAAPAPEQSKPADAAERPVPATPPADAPPPKE